MRSLNIKYVIQYANKWKPLYVNCKIQSYLVYSQNYLRKCSLLYVQKCNFQFFIAQKRNIFEFFQHFIIRIQHIQILYTHIYYTTLSLVFACIRIGDIQVHIQYKDSITLLRYKCVVYTNMIVTYINRTQTYCLENPRHFFLFS